MDDRQTQEPTITFFISVDQIDYFFENFIECIFIIFQLTPSISTSIH